MHCSSEEVDSAFVTMPDIKNGIHYLYTEDIALQRVLSNTLKAVFTGPIGIANKIWLRKEILRDLQRL